MSLRQRLLALLVAAVTVPVVMAWIAVFANPKDTLVMTQFLPSSSAPIAHPPQYPKPDGLARRLSGVGVDWYSRGMGMKTPHTKQDAAVLAGWPFRCLYAYEYRNESRRGAVPPSGSYALGIPLGDPTIYRMRLRRLPVVPLWPGMLANSALVVALLAPFLLGPTLRRTHRARRGRCTRCGYQLTPGQETCPECGGRTPTP